MKDTLQEAKDELYKTLDNEGATCPCCKQFVKSYKRKVTSAMAYSLIILNKHNPKTGETPKEFHLQDQATNLKLSIKMVADFPKLRYWGLVVQLKGYRDDGSSRNGKYYITDKGIKFIKKQETIVKYMHVYNNKHYKSSGKIVNILDCLGSKFNYNEIIS
jgi:hypothetical protein